MYQIAPNLPTQYGHRALQVSTDPRQKGGERCCAGLTGAAWGSISLKSKPVSRRSTQVESIGMPSYSPPSSSLDRSSLVLGAGAATAEWLDTAEGALWAPAAGEPSCACQTNRNGKKKLKDKSAEGNARSAPAPSNATTGRAARR